MASVKAATSTRDRLKCLKSKLGLRSISDTLDYLMDEADAQAHQIIRAVGQNGEPLMIKIDDEGILWVSIDPLRLPQEVMVPLHPESKYS